MFSRIFFVFLFFGGGCEVLGDLVVCWGVGVFRTHNSDFQAEVSSLKTDYFTTILL